MSTLQLENLLSTHRRRETQDVTLITGAARGIGAAFARALARRGRNLLLVDRRGEALSALSDTLRQSDARDVIPFEQDLAIKNAPRQILNFCRQQNLAVTTLINNAGVGLYAPFQEQPPWRIEEIIRVNVLSLVTLTRLLLPEMLKRNSGTIVNVTSISAFETSPGWSVYAATKAFVQNFTESLQAELRGTAVYVTSVCPGVTRTRFLDDSGIECPAYAQSPEEVVCEALAGIDCRLPLIVTGRSNRIRIRAQRANLRSLAAGIKRALRRVGVLS